LSFGKLLLRGGVLRILNILEYWAMKDLVVITVVVAAAEAIRHWINSVMERRFGRAPSEFENRKPHGSRAE
jgi:hypothetical protein